jgi:polar amino acid transport system substrate-binding protein
MAVSVFGSRVRMALALIVGLGLAVVASAQYRPALNSYAQPPFLSVGGERGTGLAAQFVELLNQEAGATPVFQLETLPRRRLELALREQAFAGVALFLAPEFLPAPVQQEGMWSAPVMVDENLLVAVRPLKVASLEQLEGLRFGGVAGHIYRSLGPLLDRGGLSREDAQDHIANLGKLCRGRVDFIVISKSELAGTLPHVSCPQPFLPSAFPQPQVIVRRVLVRMPAETESAEVLEAIARVACSEPWTGALARYGLSTVGCARKDMDKTPAEPGDRSRRRPGGRRQ